MNQTPDVMDLTLIVVAVNEIGKAFVLGYENFEFPATAQRDITFGSTLPTGSYVVHVDAVGEVPGKYAIFRTRLQTDRLHTQ